MNYNSSLISCHYAVRGVFNLLSVYYATQFYLIVFGKRSFSLVIVRHQRFFIFIMPRAQKPTGKLRHDPLHVQLNGDDVEAKYGRISQTGKRRKSKLQNADPDEEDEVRILFYFPVISVEAITGNSGSKNFTKNFRIGQRPARRTWLR